jgi:RNA polymerase sigma-70 factor (ECF subfamily)
MTMDAVTTRAGPGARRTREQGRHADVEAARPEGTSILNGEPAGMSALVINSGTQAIEREPMLPIGVADRRTARAAFEREALQHLDAMFSFALKLTHSRDDAEDLVSDTVLRALERWEQYRLGTNMRAWLFTILYHLFVTRKRRIDAREVAHTDDDGWSPFEAVGEADPEGRFYDSFLDEEITSAIGDLPEEYRTAVVLSDIQELRYAEIAQVLGIPEGTVKSRLFRGRRLLQQKLERYAVEMGYVRAGWRLAASA